MKRSLFLLVALVLIAVLLTGCDVKTQSWWGGAGYVYDLGNLPADICYQNGMPVVYSHSTESDGGVSIMYLANNGDVVMKHWQQDIIPGHLKEAGSAVLHGGKCPAQK